MLHTYAILKEAECQLDLAVACQVLAPILRLSKAEMQQALLDRPGILAWDLTAEGAREAAKGLIVAGIPIRVIRDDHLIKVPAVPKNTIREAILEGEHLVFRSTEWEGHVAWERIRLLDIVQQVKASSQIVEGASSGSCGNVFSLSNTERRTNVQVDVFLEIICDDPLLRIRINRSNFSYLKTGLKVHSSREMNFRALCIALNLRCENALMGPGFNWIAKGNNSHHESGNTVKKFENFATWLLTIEA